MPTPTTARMGTNGFRIRRARIKGAPRLRIKGAKGAPATPVLRIPKGGTPRPKRGHLMPPKGAPHAPKGALRALHNPFLHPTTNLHTNQPRKAGLWVGWFLNSAKR